MSADDQTFLDTLSSVPNDVKRFSGDVADYVDRHIESVARNLRETLSSSPWIPESARPKPLPKPLVPSKVIPLGLYDRIHDWILKHKFICSTTVIGIGFATFYVYRQRRSYCKKRRAKRASNGARVEVVVIAGPPSEPIVRSLALDLERRGFIVFIICSDVQEEVMVQNEARSDIRPLTIDVSNSVASGASIERLSNYLQTPQHAFDGARPHHLIFSSLILIPSLIYPSAPIATIAPTHFSDLLNTRLLQPILLTQAFLPLLTSLPFNHSQHHSSAPGTTFSPQILLLTPTIIPSLVPPFHAPESLISTALTIFFTTLRSELAPLNIPLTHLRLGAFDFSSLQPRNQIQLQNHNHSSQAQRAEVFSWPEGAREAYGRNYMSVAERGIGSGGVRGSPPRALHNAIFDVLAREKGGVINVGAGAGTYSFVGRWVPSGLVGWMMGVRKVNRRTLQASSTSSGGSENGSDEGTGLRESQHSDGEYISVYPN